MSNKTEAPSVKVDFGAYSRMSGHAWAYALSEHEVVFRSYRPDARTEKDFVTVNSVECELVTVTVRHLDGCDFDNEGWENLPLRSQVKAHPDEKWFVVTRNTIWRRDSSFGTGNATDAAIKSICAAAQDWIREFSSTDEGKHFLASGGVAWRWRKVELAEKAEDEARQAREEATRVANEAHSDLANFATEHQDILMSKS